MEGEGKERGGGGRVGGERVRESKRGNKKGEEGEG